MILGSCTGRLSLPTRAGIRFPGFFGEASDSLSVSGLVSASSEDLAGAGATGGTTGTAVEDPSTITITSRIAETSVMTGSIMVISATVTPATAASTHTAGSTGPPGFNEGMIT